MSGDPYTHSTLNLDNLRQWTRARSNSRTRPPSASSLSSPDPSYPSTPQDAVFPPLASQITPKFAVSVCNEEHWTRRHLEISTLSSSPHSSVHSPRESLKAGDDDYTDSPRTRTQTITPITASRLRNHEHLDHTMRIPFPSNQRDSASSSDSQPGQDSVSLYDEEVGSPQPTRRPLRNRVNNNTQRANADCEWSPPKCGRGGVYTSRPESTHSTASTQSTASFSRTSTSLRLKPKKPHSQRGAMNLFKSLASSSAPPIPPAEFEDIEFDWGEQRREELERRAKLLEQEYREERRAVQSHASGDAAETEETAPSRPRSWELTPEELSLRHDLEEEDARRFALKNPLWINSSRLSAHSKDSVPYPMAYDEVNVQNDRHSHDLIKHIFSGRPSIHDDIAHKNPVTVLDLGCGDGAWIVDAAQSWKNTHFYGLDLQKLHPSHAHLVMELGEQVAENIRFTYFNFLNDKLPYLDEKFDMVRMANLKWAIPEGKWDPILGEVHRVLKRGGWVEIIDDDFVLPISPNSLLSEDQLNTFDNIETELKNMLHERNLPVNISSHFMTERLGSQFNAYHEEGYAVAISMAASVEGAGQVLLPAEGMSQKAAKLMGIGLDDKNLTFSSVGSKSRSRSRSGSVSSTASRSTRDDTSTCSESLEGQSLHDSQVDSLPKQPPMFQPVGLDIHPGHFIPFPPNELTAHAIRNMQSVLACKEAIRMNELRKSPDLTGLEVKDELLPAEKRHFQRLSYEWDEQRRAFDDAFWEFESSMSKRLCLPFRIFDANDDDSSKPSIRSQSHRIRSQRNSDVGVGSPTPSTYSIISTTNTVSTTSTHSLGSSIPVRFIRVYSGWK